MRKLILGIVAVFCAQITFQIFVAIDRAGVDLRARNDAQPLVAPVVDRSVPAIDVAELSDNDTTEQIDVERTATRGVDRSIARRSTSRNIGATIAYGHTLRRPLITTRFAAAVAMVQSPAHLDIAPPGAPRESSDAHLVSKKVSHSHKRSLFARVLPVIKKPYELLKLVGSKLR